MATDHERIWLQSEEGAANHEEGRLWCQDDVWDGDSTEYVRADLCADLLEMTELLERCLVYQIRKSELAGDHEGAGLQRFTLVRVREVLAKTVAA